MTAPWGSGRTSERRRFVPSGGGAAPWDARARGLSRCPVPTRELAHPVTCTPPPARWAPLLPAGLRQRREVPGKSAVFSGEHFVLEETDWYLLNLFRLWWHYGISFLRLQMWVEEVMEKFMR